MSATRWDVQIVNSADGKPKRWDTYESRDRAESVAATLRKHRFYVQARRVAGADEIALESATT